MTAAYGPHRDRHRETRIPLDPFVSDLDAESAALRAAGPLAAVDLPGGVDVWAVTRHAEAKKLLTDPRLVKDINVWGAWQRGEIPAGLAADRAGQPAAARCSPWTAPTTGGCAPWSPRRSPRAGWSEMRAGSRS